MARGAALGPGGVLGVECRHDLRFFRDNPNNEESSGAVARIRIWDKALSPTQVANLDRLP